MKFYKIILFFIVYYFFILQASANDENNKYTKEINTFNLNNPITFRNLQTDESEIYYINITYFSFKENELYLNINCDNNIPKNISLSLELNLYISEFFEEDGSWDSEYYFSDFIINNGSGEYYSTINYFNVTRFTEISISEAYIFDEVNYYVNYPFSFLIIDPPYEPYISNISLVSVYDYKITIIDFYLNNNSLDFIFEFEPDIPPNITLRLILDVTTYNETLGYYIGENYVEIIYIDDTFEKYSINLNNLKISGQTEIFIADLSVIGNSYDYNIYIDYSYNSIMIQSDESSTDVIYDDIDTIIDETNNNVVISYKSSGGSSKMGIIAGAIGGGIVVIGIIVTVFICIRKRNNNNNKKTQNNIQDNNNTQDNTPNDQTNPTIINLFPSEISIRHDESEYKVNIKKPKENLRTFFLENEKQDIIVILSLDCKKNINDLRKLYFEILNRNDLYKDQSIFFLCEAKCLDVNSKDTIETYFKDYRNYYSILVIDEEDKLNKK